ncbi:MAG: phosphoesterase [Ruminococcaceae bacterium]|nr:phosphoesterase [Oscillospiraceae bacterium]
MKIKERTYLLWLLIWPIEFVWYGVLNSFAREMPRYFTVHCFVDDLIPFVPFFVIFYILWYLYNAGTILFFAFCEKESFKKLLLFLYIEMFLCLIFGTIFPNGHDFRPIISGDEGIFYYLVNVIYKMDSGCVTVMPSMHVMNSIGITFAIGNSDALSKYKWLSPVCWLFTILVALSTVFIKQHSIIDVFVAVVVCIPLYIFVYKIKFPIFKKNKAI